MVTFIYIIFTLKVDIDIKILTYKIEFQEAKMYHPRFKGNHYAMGRKFGQIVNKTNTKFPIKLGSIIKNSQHG